jgi:Lhr-like helicase
MSFKKILPEVKQALTTVGIEGVSEFGKTLLSTIKSGSHVFALAPKKSGKTTTAIVASFDKVNKQL